MIMSVPSSLCMFEQSMILCKEQNALLKDTTRQYQSQNHPVYHINFRNLAPVTDKFWQTNYGASV